jgi:polysaccharide biosynthesis/export protein
MIQPTHAFISRFRLGLAICSSALLIAIPTEAQSQQASPVVGAIKTPAPPVSDANPAKEVAVSSGYLLSPGDKLRVSVYKDPQSSLDSVQVRPDGKITMPLIGDIEAAGLPPSELRDGIAKALKQYVNDPVVTVIVIEATAPTVFVVGEVNHPGSVTLQPGMTVLQVLAVAGGLKDFADAGNIRILRKGAPTIQFNYRDAMKGNGSNPRVQAGDTIAVPD